MELVLNTYGAALVKENGQLVVIHKDGKQIVPLDKIKSIIVSKGAKISSDATLLAIDNEIEILFVDGTGKPKGRVWSIQYGSISTIRRKQLDFTFTKHAVNWIKEILCKKIDNQIALIYSITPVESDANKVLDKNISKLNDYKQKIKNKNADVISDIAPSLRGWEGASSRIYFEMINKIIPSKYKFVKRSQHPATDIFNAVLNYAYGVLYGKVEGALIKAGLDPYIGIMHRENYNRPVLVFDLIELYRVWIDYVVINLISQNVINEDCYSVKDDGSYWLEALGRRILIQSINDYLDEVVNITGVNRSRVNHINLYAQKLATRMSKIKSR